MSDSIERAYFTKYVCRQCNKCFVHVSADNPRFFSLTGMTMENKLHPDCCTPILDGEHVLMDAMSILDGPIIDEAIYLFRNKRYTQQEIIDRVVEKREYGWYFRPYIK